jgi:group I intron endonuclease
MEKIDGVYAIIHILSGKLYVGSAIGIYKRWSEHRSELTYNYHDNPRLQNAWNKYGPDAFEFKILEIVTDPAMLLAKEQFWMDKLQSYDRTKGYNIRKKAESNFGLKHTSETRKKMSESGKGKHNNSGENNPFFGKQHTEEVCKKMRKPKSEAGRLNILKAAKKRAQKAYLIKKCLGCGIEFKTRKCEDFDFCNRLCSIQYYGKLKTQNGIIEKTCLLCPNKFKTSISQDKKYCSRKCWAVSLIGNKRQTKKTLDK